MIDAKKFLKMISKNFTSTILVLSSMMVMNIEKDLLRIDACLKNALAKRYLIHWYIDTVELRDLDKKLLNLNKIYNSAKNAILISCYCAY